MSESETAIERHNRVAMWRDVGLALRKALTLIDAAQNIMEDLDVPHIADNIDPYVKGIERFASLAEEKSDE